MIFGLIVAGLITALTTVAVETNVPAVSDFGDKYLSAKPAEEIAVTEVK